ncbi:NIPSNAP family [Verrucomicrobiia bacterium DG1235]|nr:NIPSNAP family [Verrucomicrobiae bacterium DG1235]
MIRFLIPILALCVAALLSSCSKSEIPMKDDRLFELRVYYPHPGKLDALNNRFRDHTLAIFEKHGMEHVGYWLTEEDEPKLIYLIAFESKAAKDKAWKDFVDDPDWKAAYANSIKDGKLVARVDSTMLRTTDYSPAIVQIQANPERLFELRTYKATDGNLSHLDARFRDHTIDLFEKHGMTNLVYFHVAEDEEGSEDTLIYLLAHKSRKERDANFGAFAKDPAWQEARAASEAAAGGSLTQPDGVKNVFLLPVDYSKIK